MNERQLLALKYAIETGTTTQAADLLHVTQPAISRMLSTLEHDLGIPLFERQHGKISPTPQALYFLDAAERVLESMNDARKRVETIRTLSVGQLRIASLPGLAFLRLASISAEFRKQHPEVRISIQARTSVQVRELVGSGIFDVGICEPPWPSEDFAIEAYRTECVCAFHKDHPLAALSVITPHDLAGERLSLLYPQHISTHHFENIMHEAGVSWSPGFESNLFPIALSYALETGSIAIIDPLTAHNYPSDVLTIRPFEPCLTFDFAIIHSHKKPLTPEAEDFLDILRQDLYVYASRRSHTDIASRQELEIDRNNIA